MDWSALMAQLSSLWHAFPTLPLAGKVAGVLAILIGLVKSSALQPLWNKIGAWKVLVAPALGLVVSILSIQPLSWAGVWIGLSGGILAVGITNVLDAVKMIPGLGSMWVGIINLVEKVLGAPAQSPAAPLQAAAMKQKCSKK